ncbi:MAG: trigger factor, partial [Rhodospirillales bacterium]
MADSQNIRRTLELTIPAPEVEEETERVVESIRKRVRLPGFRPGKVPAGIVRRRYEQDIRHDVLEKLIPKYLFKRAEEEGLNVVGTPNVTDVQFAPGEPLRFKAEFEVAPEIELKQYKDLTVPYQDPEVSEADIDQRIEELREQKAEYVNVDPRPIAAGDHAVVAL